MMRNGLAVLLGLLLAGTLFPTLAMAETISGTVVTSTPSIGRLVLQKEDGKRTTIRVSKFARISVDGRGSTLESLKPDWSVTALISGGAATRLIVTSRSSDADPAPDAPAGSDKPEKPAEPPAEKPAPKKAAVETPPEVAGAETTVSKTPAGTETSRTARRRMEAVARRDDPNPKDEPAIGAASSRTGSSDWNQFRGPNRDNISRETGLLTEWPADGPPLAWSATGVGEGYSSVSVVDGRVYTMGNLGDAENVIALDLATGRRIWATPTGPAYREGQGNGPRGTPTVVDGRVYALGANGDLVCLEADSGRGVWQRNVLREFEGRNITWGISESVLIDGDQLICTPGGRRGTMVALNRNTGANIWQAVVPTTPQASYSSAVVMEVGGVRQYVNFTHAGVVGIRARDGQVMWGQQESANGTANCSSAVFDNDTVFTASGYGTGGALFRLSSRSGQTGSQVVYQTREMQNHHGGMVVVDGHLYGANEAILTCLELRTGDRKWRDRSVGKGSLTCADGHLYMRSENGPVALIRLSQDGYEETGRFDQPQRSGRPAWSHPVVSQGMLFLRDMDRLLAYDVRGR